MKEIKWLFTRLSGETENYSFDIMYSSGRFEIEIWPNRGAVPRGCRYLFHAADSNGAMRAVEAKLRELGEIE